MKFILRFNEHHPVSVGGGVRGNTITFREFEAPSKIEAVEEYRSARREAPQRVQVTLYQRDLNTKVAEARGMVP